MDLNEIMKQAQAMQQKMAGVQAEMLKREAEGKAGGGLVKAVVNGKGEMVKITIDNEVIKPEEKDILQDLIVAAFNDAKSKMEGEFNNAMSAIAADMGLPEGFKFPS